MDDKTMKISKKCPKCGRRLFDKISPASGFRITWFIACGTVIHLKNT